MSRPLPYQFEKDKRLRRLYTRAAGSSCAPLLKTTSDNKFPNGRWELISEESSNNDLGSYIIISLPKLQAGPSADQPLATYHDFKLNGSDFTGRWSHPEYGSGDANGRFDDDGKLHMHFPVDNTNYVFTREGQGGSSGSGGKSERSS